MSTLERDYGHLPASSLFFKKWMWFADRACEKLPTLTKVEQDLDLAVNFETNPKLQALVELLEQLKPCSKKKRFSKTKSGEGDDDPPEGTTYTLLIAVKSPKLCNDLQKFLTYTFAKDGRSAGKQLYEDKLRFHLVSHREFCRREAILHKRPEQRGPAPVEACEQFLLHKLSLLMDQKNENRMRGQYF